MRRETAIIALIILLVLVPMWYVALHGEAPSEEIEIDQSVTEMHPLAGFLDTPNKLSPSQVGVVVWVALFGLVGALVVSHRFMNEAVRPPDDADAVVTEERAAGHASLPWFETETRWVVEYDEATESVEGIVAMGALTILAIAFAALFTGEYFTLARTQYFGVYAAGMFLSLTGLTVSYYAWFVPHVKVAEERGHT